MNKLDEIKMQIFRDIWVWLLVLFLISSNFLIQSFDFIQFCLNPSGYYYFDPKTMDWNSFSLNKLIRVIINLILLQLIMHHFYIRKLPLQLLLFAGILFLAGIDILYLQKPSFFTFRIHEFVSPLVFSPLLAIIFLVLLISKKWLN